MKVIQRGNLRQQRPVQTCTFLVILLYVRLNPVQIKMDFFPHFRYSVEATRRHVGYFSFVITSSCSQSSGRRKLEMLPDAVLFLSGEISLSTPVFSLVLFSKFTLRSESLPLTIQFYDSYFHLKFQYDQYLISVICILPSNCVCQNKRTEDCVILGFSSGMHNLMYPCH